MMADVGQIKYTVAVDTSDTLKAQKAVDRSTDAMSTSFSSAESRITDSARKINTEVKRSSEGVSRAMKANYGQAGIQVQQFVGQIQGGQSAMVALAQQSADLGIVLGAPMVGVIVSLAAVLAGTLAPAIFSSKSNLEQMQAAVEKVKAVMTVGADGVANYSEEMVKLARISDVISKAQVSAAIINQEKAMKSSLNAMEESFRGFGSFYDERTEKIASNTKLPLEAINQLEKALKFRNLGDAEERIGRFESALDLMSGSLDKSNKKGKELFESLSNMIAEYTKNAEVLDKLKGSNEELNTTSTKAKDIASELTLQLISQRIALEEGERAAFQFKLQMDGLKESQKDGLLALYDYNEAQKDAKKLSDQRSQDLESEIDGYIRLADSIETARVTKERQDAAKKQRDTERLESQVQAIGLTPLEQIEARYEQELQMLRDAEEAGIQIKGEYAEREKQLQLEKTEAIKALNKDVNDDLSRALESFQTQAIGAFTQFATGAQTGSEAVRGLANSVLNYAVGALAKMAIQAIIGQKTVEATTTASAGVMSSALATPAALMSLATAGSNSIPAMTGMTTTVGLAQGFAMSGARMHGGGVGAGNSYLVGENGPEIFTPSGFGSITNNNNIIGGGGDVNVVVNNNAAGTQATAKQSDDGRIVEITINEINNQINRQQGSIVRSLKQKTNLQFKASR